MIITKEKIDLIKRAAERTRRSADLFASNNNPSVQDIKYRTQGLADAFEAVLGLLLSNSTVDIKVCACGADLIRSPETKEMICPSLID